MRVTTRAQNGGISAASNDALALASGEWVVLLDHDDLLRPHALSMVAETVACHPGSVFVYSDEDKVDAAGRRADPYFKPDWNPALFYSQNYICHLAAFRLSMATRVGGFRPEFDGAQDWDLFLRLLAGVPAEAIRHIPHVLYHWRMSEASTASSLDAKPYALTAATNALRQRLAEDGIEADVETVCGRYQRVRYHLPADPPPVTVVIPTTGDVALLGPCLKGLLHGTDYPKLTILLALNARTTNGSGTRAYVEEAATDPRVRLLINEDDAFNYSRVNNRAVPAADDDLICFLNDDTEPINRDWLSSMVGHLMQDRVGAVGAKLYYPQGSIQHGGVVLGLGGVAGHLHTRLDHDADGYFGRANLDQDLSCVTAGCMLIRRAVFEEAGGFDEALAIAFNDVDLCIRIRAADWRIVWTPSAELYHRESISVGRHDSPARVKEFEHEVSLVRNRWGAVLDFDPHYSPNLSLEYQWELAFPPRVSYPWRQQRSGPG